MQKAIILLGANSRFFYLKLWVNVKCYCCMQKCNYYLYMLFCSIGRLKERERWSGWKLHCIKNKQRDNLFFPHPHFTLMTRDTHHLVIIFIIGIIYLALERSETENDSMIHWFIVAKLYFMAYHQISQNADKLDCQHSTLWCQKNFLFTNYSNKIMQFNTTIRLFVHQFVTIVSFNGR